MHGATQMFPHDGSSASAKGNYNIHKHGAGGGVPPTGAS